MRHGADLSDGAEAEYAPPHPKRSEEPLMSIVPCPDCGRPAEELERFVADGTEYARLRCGSAPALLLPAADLACSAPGLASGPRSAAS